MPDSGDSPSRSGGSPQSPVRVAGRVAVMVAPLLLVAGVVGWQIWKTLTPGSDDPDELTGRAKAEVTQVSSRSGGGPIGSQTTVRVTYTVDGATYSDVLLHGPDRTSLETGRFLTVAYHPEAPGERATTVAGAEDSGPHWLARGLILVLLVPPGLLVVAMLAALLREGPRAVRQSGGPHRGPTRGR